MKLAKQLLGLFLLLITVATAVPSIQARPAQAVTLIAFTGTPLTNGVRLFWETGTELGTAAFMLQRSSNGGGFANLTQIVDENNQPYPGGIVEAEGSATIGATYIVIDATAVTGQTYTYQLVEVETNNTLTPLATVIVTAGATPSPTPIPIGGGGSNSTPTPSGSPTPVATASTGNNAGQPAGAGGDTLPTRVRIFNTVTPITAASPTAVNSTNTLPGTTNTSSPTPTATRGEAVAQVQPTIAAYPAESEPASGSPAGGSPYPGELVVPDSPTTTPTPYPVNSFLETEAPTPTIVGVVGSQDGNGSVTGAGAADAAQDESASSRGVLWGAFMLALGLFIAAVVGAIQLFIRKR